MKKHKMKTKLNNKLRSFANLSFNPLFISYNNLNLFRDDKLVGSKLPSFGNITEGETSPVSLGKVYKYKSIINISSFRTVTILPGDLCGCRMFYFLGGIYG